MVTKYFEKTRTLTIWFDGDIDHHSCSEIAIHSDDAIKKYLPQKLIMDFKEVRFMDSAGIGMVIGRYKQLLRFGGITEIVNVSKEIKRIFDMVGIFKIIHIVDSN